MQRTAFLIAVAFTSLTCDIPPPPPPLPTLTVAEVRAEANASCLAISIATETVDGSPAVEYCRETLPAIFYDEPMLGVLYKKGRMD
jgi:hypothetical protein